MATDDDRIAFYQEYERRRPQHDRVLRQIWGFFDEYRRTQETDPKLRVHSVRGRVKTIGSLETKSLGSTHVGTLDPAVVFKEVKDVVGVRVVCNTLEGKTAACKWIERFAAHADDETAGKAHGLFRVHEARPVEYATGYRSQHYLVTLIPDAWPTLLIDDADRDDEVTIEIQVRTILEEAWGEIEHDLIYKSKAQPLDRENEVLMSGFKALSHRLHDADILVQRLAKRIVDDPVRARARMIAEQQRSLGVDTRKLGLTDGAARELEGMLKEAEEARLVGSHEDAFGMHERMKDDPRFVSPTATSVLLSEMALDRLMQAEAVLGARDRSKADDLLVESWNHYEAALQADPEGNPVIFLWRQSRVRVFQEQIPAARELLSRALKEFERHGKASYIRTPFYKASIKARLGAIDLENLFKEHGREHGEHVPSAPGTEERVQAIRSLLDQAVGDLRDARPPGSLAPREWMLDNLYIYNNLAWFLFRLGEFRDAQQAVKQARELVEPAIWEQDLNFLDTMLAIDLALLPERPSLSELTLIDSWRIRILNILSVPGTYVPRYSVREMLARIQEFEARWRMFIEETAIKDPERACASD